MGLSGAEVVTSRAWAPADPAEAPAPPQDFAEFYRAYYPLLVRYALRLTGEPETARDIAQEALTRTFTRWVGVRNKEGYAYLVTTNLARDRWSARRRETELLRRIGPPAASPPPDVLVRDAVSRLPNIVVLHYFADLTVEQIAAVVKRPAGTVKQRLFAARKALEEALRDD